MKNRFKEQGDHIFSWHQHWIIDNPIRRMIHPVERILKGSVTPGMIVADTGCGTGAFTLALAHMVGDTGRVIAVDLQAEALVKVEQKAEMAGMHRRIETWKCEADDIGNLPVIDFAFAFYMVHEVPDMDRYFSRMAQCIKPGGGMLLVEPKFHVSRAHFETELAAAAKVGLVSQLAPQVRLSHAALLKRT